MLKQRRNLCSLVPGLPRDHKKKSKNSFKRNILRAAYYRRGFVRQCWLYIRTGRTDSERPWQTRRDIFRSPTASDPNKDK